MTMYIKTSEKVRVENYPYSFNLKTTLFDSVEFNAKKGYRHVTQTINPKTGRENNPKRGVYYPLLVRYYNQEGHIKSATFDFNGDEAINKGLRFIADHFDLFTPEEISYLYQFIIAMGVVDMKATAIYGGSDVEALKPLYETFFKLGWQGAETGENLFASMVLDSEAIDRTKPENYNPFKIASYETN
jgi:hypothetical protein